MRGLSMGHIVVDTNDSAGELVLLVRVRVLMQRFYCS